MRFKVYIKSLWGYLCIILLFLFISYFVDANLGSTLLITFSALLVLSLITFILSIFTTKVIANCNDMVVSKNQKVYFDVTIESKLPIAVCFMELQMKKQEYLKEMGDGSYRFMTDSFSPKNIKLEYEAKVFGEDVIEITDLVIRDFMGLFMFKKKVKNQKFKVTTLPIYRETMYDKSLLKLSSYAADFDDSEEVNGIPTSTSGFPGYEHREYVIGDSHKRINYKLSAKKNKIMIRLDEPVAGARQAVMLDYTTSNDRYKDEIALEGLMAYVGYLTMNNIMTEVYLMTNEGPVKLLVSSFSDMEYILDICKKVKFYEDLQEGADFVLARCDRISSIIIFTAGKKSKLINKSFLAPTFIVTTNDGELASNEFYIDSNLMIGKGGKNNEAIY